MRGTLLLSPRLSQLLAGTPPPTQPPVPSPQPSSRRRRRCCCSLGAAILTEGKPEAIRGAAAMLGKGKLRRGRRETCPPALHPSRMVTVGCTLRHALDVPREAKLEV